MMSSLEGSHCDCMALQPGSAAYWLVLQASRLLNPSQSPAECLSPQDTKEARTLKKVIWVEGDCLGNLGIESGRGKERRRDREMREGSRASRLIVSRA